MIKFGLKLWTSNPAIFFEEAGNLARIKKVDFVELYNNPETDFDFNTFLPIKEISVSIHNTHSHSWHEFNLGEKQLKIWQNTLRLADYFKSQEIVVHLGQAANLKCFKDNLKKIEDPRILLENMAGIDVYGKNVFAQTLKELMRFRKLQPICFDIEKAIKSACWQNIDYKKFINDCIDNLKPRYFHISGGDKNNPIDEHKNLWESNFDFAWLADRFNCLAKAAEIKLVFETPKGKNLENDLKNMGFFRKFLFVKK